MFELLQRGGIMMIPIAASSVVALAIVLERAYRFHQARPRVEQLMPPLKKLVAAGELKEARSLCGRTPGLVARLVGDLLEEAHRPVEEIDKAVSLRGSRYLRELSRYLRGLSVIGNLTPLMGLLGTVFGMVRAFIQVADLGGNVNPSVLASGIWEALLTTAAGLAVAIPVLIASHYFEGRLDDVSFQMETVATEVIQLLPERDGRGDA